MKFTPQLQIYLYIAIIVATFYKSAETRKIHI